MAPEQRVHFWDESYYEHIGDMGALCRFIHWPIVTDEPTEVTCGHCITKMKKFGIHPKEST